MKVTNGYLLTNTNFISGNVWGARVNVPSESSSRPKNDDTSYLNSLLTNILISCDFFLAHGFLKIVFLAKCCIFLFKCKLKIKII